VYNSSLMLMGAAPLVLNTQIMPYPVSIYLFHSSVSESENLYTYDLVEKYTPNLFEPTFIGGM